jgi:hypothetical protein
VAQYDGNRGWRLAIAALAAVGNSGKSAPEVGGEQALWQGVGVVDRFEVRKRSEGGSPELSTVVLVATGETAMKGWTGGRGGKRLGREATRWFHNSGMAAQWGVEGGGRRKGPS